MEISESVNCCSLIEIGNFNNETSQESILNLIKNRLYYNYLSDNDDPPKAFFATTHEQQKKAEIALKALGFIPRKFKSRHDIGKKKSLIHWMLLDIPKELKPWFNKTMREQKKSNKKDWF